MPSTSVWLLQVSAMECGLLPMSHEAIICGEASVYDYTGCVSGEEEFDKIARTLGPNNKVMILRNFGFLVGGESLEEAFHYAFNLMIACESQVSPYITCDANENIVLLPNQWPKIAK